MYLYKVAWTPDEDESLRKLMLESTSPSEIATRIFICIFSAPL
jgi:hypothetical protein